MVSVNQVRQLYVVNGADTAKVGGIEVKETVDKKCVFLEVNGKGGLVRSDLIKKGNIISAKLTKAEKMATPLKEAKIAFVNPEYLVAGQDYIVDIMVSNYITLAETSTLVKFGAVRATTSMKDSDFYLELAKSFARNFSREVNKFFEIYLEGDSTGKEVTVNSKHEGTFTAVIIKEVAQTADYVRGEFPVTPVNFQVVPHTIYVDGGEVNPFTEEENGTVTLENQKGENSYIGNGYELADTEYFCMGERGDWYRGVGYPNTIKTKYMIDETAEYDVIDINFYFEGRGISAQKSEKLLTLVVPKGDTAIVGLFDGIITIEKDSEDNE